MKELEVIKAKIDATKKEMDLLNETVIIGSHSARMEIVKDYKCFLLQLEHPLYHNSVNNTYSAERLLMNMRSVLRVNELALDKYKESFHKFEMLRDKLFSLEEELKKHSSNERMKNIEKAKEELYRAMIAYKELTE